MKPMVEPSTICVGAGCACGSGWCLCSSMPLLALVAFSFNDSKRNIVWKGFTFKYYQKAWENSGLVEAFANSW
ncbi:hypothetical protein [Hankyongella ginsenosidimutans]|uniref:hypothetical protein n=1 Tax=Hankyongella ginsenosidimutans TaxID=1763828 RepID=UPI00319DC59F